MPATVTADTQNEKLLRLRARCPSCGSAPALRITPRLAEHARNYSPQEPMATYQCQRRRCGTIYAISAHACINSV